MDQNFQVEFEFSSLSQANQEILRAFHSSLKAVTEDLDPERNGFNTAIARMIEFINAMYKYQLAKGEREDSREYNDEDRAVINHCLLNFLKTIAPFTPHLSEELWWTLILKRNPEKDKVSVDSVHKQKWPSYISEYLELNTFNLVIQIKGKKIDLVEVPRNLSEKELEEIALNNDKLKKRLEGLDIKKIIVVPNKLVNIVAV